MKSILISLMVAFLVSCSHQETDGSKKSSSYQGTKGKSEQKVKERTLSSKKKAAFSAHEDFFQHPDLKAKDIFFEESLYRLDSSDLSSLSGQEDPLTKIIAFCYQKNFKKAYGLIDQIYFEFKDHPTYWNQVGTCHLLEGSGPKARLYYNKALELNKNYPPALNNLGILYILEKKEQKAFVAFKMAKEKSPFSLTPLFNLGQLSLRYGFLKEAKESFQTLYNRNRSDTDALIGLATAQLFQNNLGESLQLFEQLNAALWKKPVVGINYSLALKLGKREEESQKILSQVKQEDLGPWQEYYQKVVKIVGLN